MLGAAIREQGRYVEADKLIDPVVAFFESNQNKKLMESSVWVEAGRLRFLEGRYEEANVYLQRGLGKHHARHDELHPNSIRLHTALAELQLQQHKYADAIAMASMALSLAKKSIPNAQFEIANIQNILGYALFLSGDKAKGAALVMKSYEDMKRDGRKENLVTAAAKQRVQALQVSG